MPRLAEPRREVHVDPVVVAVLERRLAGVDPDPHAHRPVGPRVLRVRCAGSPRAAPTASAAASNAIENSSPRQSSSRPFDALDRSAHELAVIGEQRGVRGPSRCASCVDPSRSVKRSVTLMTV